MVTGNDDGLRLRILDSAQVVTTTNAAGCPVGAHIPPIGTAPRTGPPIGELTNVDLISVCRYHPGSVAYSYVQSGAKAEAILAMLRDAKPGTGPDRANCQPLRPEDHAGMYRLWSGSTHTDVWVHFDGCGGRGIDDGTSTREVNPEVIVPFVDVGYGGGVPAEMVRESKDGRSPHYVP